MELTLQLNMAMLVSVVVAEVVSVVWHNSSVGHHIGERSLLPAVLCNSGLVVLLKFVTDTYWSVATWQQAVYLALWVAAVYFCLEGPQYVPWRDTGTAFLLNALHKFTVVYAVLLTLSSMK